ncbi:hypothetical protein Ntsu_33790 [Nocardia sp. IFM 10818]
MLAGGITWLGDDVQDDFGWTAYTPLSDQPRRYADYLPSNGFDAMGAVSLTAFCLLVLAAIAAAVTAGRLAAGIVTVAVPFAAGALIWLALPRGHSGFSLQPVATLVVILMAVAIREVWEWRLARTAART